MVEKMYEKDFLYFGDLGYYKSKCLSSNKIDCQQPKFSGVRVSFNQ
jgi:hypothetical protein